MNKCKQNNKQVYTPIIKSHSKMQGYFLDGVSTPDEPALLTLNLVLQTGFLKAAKPMSTLLLGQAGIGKTRLLSPLQKLDFVSYVNDITPKYLVRFLESVEKGEKKFLAIPDFTNCTGHSKSTRTTLTSILRSMTEEGVSDLSDYGLEFEAKKPVRAGLITATTSDSFEAFRKSWKGTGFLSRLLPFSFKHSVITTNSIMDRIDAGNPDSIASLRLKVVKKPSHVECPTKLLHQLRVYEEALSLKMGSLPYRPQLQLRALAESLAILRGDSKLSQNDIDTIVRLSKWLNYDFKEL